jgi:hypothetical protein
MDMKCRIFIVGLLILAWAGWMGLASGQDPTTGSIDGTVTDSAGNPLTGATVTITSGQGAKTVVTDSGGMFRFPYLTPGSYGLTATLHGYTTAERQNIEVRLLSRVRVEVVLTPGMSEKIEVVGSAPVVDLSSTTTGATISSALMSSIPLGRGFANTLALAPGVVESGIDNSNPSIAGSSGLENTYMVDGMSIGNTGYGSAGSYSIVYGSLGMGVNYDYIQEVQVKTGGYEPEYGEALGGFVNLITKSGTNTLTGSVFTYQQLSDLEAERVKTDRLRATFDPIGFSSQDYGFEAGGPIVKDKAFWFAAFDPTITTRTRKTAAAITADTTQGFSHTVDIKRTIYNYAANLKLNLSPKHTLSVSAFGDPSVGDNGPQREAAVAVPDPTLKYSKIEYGGNNVVGHWNGELLSNVFVEGTVAHHQDKFKETPGEVLPSGIDNRTAIPLRYGGVGFFEDATSKNTQYQLKFSSFLQAAGEHNLRYGWIYQNIGYTETPNYSGRKGISIKLAGPDEEWDTADDIIETSTSGYTWDIRKAGDRFRINRIRSGSLGADTRTTYSASFISDTWNPTKYLSIMAGIRNEMEQLSGNVTNFTWLDNWSPRLHVTVDPTMDNRTKLSFAYGRFFGKIPNDLAVRALSQEKSYNVYYDLQAITDATLNPDNPLGWDDPQGLIPGNQTRAPVATGTSQTLIAPDAKLSYLDEFIVGAEREVIPFLNVGVSYMHRALGRTLEDIAIVPYSAILDTLATHEEFGEYIIDNPGAPYWPKPTRNYDAVSVKVEKRLSNDWQVLASYTYSRLRGNYEGYFRRDNGQSDPFITSAFDFPYLYNTAPHERDYEIWEYTAATDGVLPSDRPHVLNVYGSYRLNYGVTIGLSLKVQSGIPITKLGYNENYGNGGEILLEPRGASGRGPKTSNVGLHVDYPIDLTKTASGIGIKTLELSVDVFNVFNQQEGVNFEYEYEIGGTVDPQEWLLNPPGQYDIKACPDCVNPDFKKPTDYMDPRQIVLALRAGF